MPRCPFAPSQFADLLATVPALLEQLTMLDARQLRRASKTLRMIVAELPWDDAAPATVLASRLRDWKSSFPAAATVNLFKTKLPTSQMKLLTGVRRLVITNSHFDSDKHAEGELPFSVVRSLPHLESLAITSRKHSRRRDFVVDPFAAVWHELNSLRELSLDTSLKCLPVSLLDGLTALRVLRIRVSPDHGGTAGSPVFRVSDIALQRLSQLTNLELHRVAHTRPHYGELANPIDAALFTGSSLASLRALSTFVISDAAPPPGFLSFLPPGLQVLDVSSCTLPPNPFAALPASVKTLRIASCSNLSDADFVSLAHVRSLTVLAPSSVSYVAFAALEALDELILAGYIDCPRLLCDELLGILGSFGRLRRLSVSAVKYWDRSRCATFTDAGLANLAHCPLEHLDLGLSMPRVHLSNAGLAILSTCPLKDINLSGIRGDVSQAGLVAIPGLRVLTLTKSRYRRFFRGGVRDPVPPSLSLTDFVPSLVVRCLRW